MIQVEVVSFDPQYASAYALLNRQWIETYFEIEPMDLLQLENPQQLILDHGGEIFFVLEDKKAVGTCALIPHGPGCFELAKMAVAPSTRGKGYGNLLLQTVIQWAKTKGVQRIILLSNTRLKPALNLYEKHGFKTLSIGPHPDYKRADIEMELVLEQNLMGPYETQQRSMK